MERKDKVAEIITKKLIESLETIIKTGKGDIPWKKPWKPSYITDDGKIIRGPVNAITGRPYHGINAMILSGVAYGKPWFLSLKQILALGFRVKREEYTKSYPVLYWAILKKEEEDDNGNKKIKKIFFKRFYSVYHWSQIDAKEESIMEKLPVLEKIKKAEIKYNIKLEALKAEAENYKIAQSFVDNMPKKPIIVEDQDDAAFYRPATDDVHLPSKTAFESQPHFYSTLFHELVHSTGHSTRCNRKEIQQWNGFGSHEYSKEELVAEVGSSFLCAEAGIETPALAENTVAYCRSWLKVLKNDVNMLIEASAKAQKAVNFILAKTYDEATEE